VVVEQDLAKPVTVVAEQVAEDFENLFLVPQLGLEVQKRILVMLDRYQLQVIQ
jgi:hypothetical protein|tara:strand:+ start:197 stop:355 length:159 start_codon:yes stop_codon:yes gene_type:complete